MNKRTNGQPNSETVAAVSLLWLKSLSFLGDLNDNVNQVVWSDKVLEKQKKQDKKIELDISIWKVLFLY